MRSFQICDKNLTSNDQICYNNCIVGWYCQYSQLPHKNILTNIHPCKCQHHQLQNIPTNHSTTVPFLHRAVTQLTCKNEQTSTYLPHLSCLWHDLFNVLLVSPTILTSLSLCRRERDWGEIHGAVPEKCQKSSHSHQSIRYTWWASNYIYNHVNCTLHERKNYTRVNQPLYMAHNCPTLKHLPLLKEFTVLCTSRTAQTEFEAMAVLGKLVFFTMHPLGINVLIYAISYLRLAKYYKCPLCLLNDTKILYLTLCCATQQFPSCTWSQKKISILSAHMHTVSKFMMAMPGWTCKIIFWEWKEVLVTKIWIKLES